MILSLRLRLARAATGLDQIELAEALGVRQQQISVWERGSATPRADTLAQIAQTVDVCLDWLVSGSGFMYNHDYWLDLIKWFSRQLVLHTVRRAVIVRWPQFEIERLGFLLDTSGGCLSAVGLRKGSGRYGNWPTWSANDAHAYADILSDLGKRHIPVGHVTLSEPEGRVLHLGDLSQLFTRAVFDAGFLPGEIAGIPPEIIGPFSIQPYETLKLSLPEDDEPTP